MTILLFSFFPSFPFVFYPSLSEQGLNVTRAQKSKPQEVELFIMCPDIARKQSQSFARHCFRLDRGNHSILNLS